MLQPVQVHGRIVVANNACSRRQRLSRRLRAGCEETSVGEKASAAPGASRLKLSLGEQGDSWKLSICLFNLRFPVLALAMSISAYTVLANDSLDETRSIAKKARKARIEGLKSYKLEPVAFEKLLEHGSRNTSDITDSTISAIINIDSLAVHLNRNDPYSVLCTYLSSWKRNDLDGMNSLLITSMRRTSLSEKVRLSALTVHQIKFIPESTKAFIRFRVVMTIVSIDQGPLPSGCYDWDCYLYYESEMNWLVSGCGF